MPARLGTPLAGHPTGATGVTPSRLFPLHPFLAQVEDQNAAAGPHGWADRLEPAVGFRLSLGARHRALEIDLANAGSNPPLHRRIRRQRTVGHTCLTAHIVHSGIG